MVTTRSKGRRTGTFVPDELMFSSARKKRRRSPTFEVGQKCKYMQPNTTKQLNCTIVKIYERSNKALISFAGKRKDESVSVDNLIALAERKTKRSRKLVTPKRRLPKVLPGGGTGDGGGTKMDLDSVSPIPKSTPAPRKARRRINKIETPLNNRGQDDSAIIDPRDTDRRRTSNSLSPTLERSFQVNLTFTRERSESPLRETVVSGEVARTNAWKKLKREDKIRRVQDSLVTREAKVKMAAGRESERRTIHEFLTKNLRNGTGGSLYICGSPGTGKSATLAQTKKELPNLIKKAGLDKRDVEIVVLNGFNMNQPQEVYVRLLDAILERRSNLPARKAGEILSGTFQNDKRKRRRRYIVVVDEIDGLLQKSQRVLYTLFSWPVQPQSNLLLIGIANSMNLTDRFLPKLESRKCSPQTLVFKPYTKDHLKAIVKQRLLPFQNSSTDPFGPFFEEDAIKRLTHKIGAVSGDVRKTLEMCRYALDDLLTKPSEKRVTFQMMNSILREHYKSPFSHSIQELPFFGKAMVTSFVHFFAKRKEGSLSQLRAFYNHITKEYSIPQVPSPDEFNEIFANLASQGLVCPVGKNRRIIAKKRKGALSPDSLFTFKVLKDDVELAVESDPLLANLLSFQATIPGKILL